MANHASNIIDAKTISRRRMSKKAAVQSLARLQSPPDLQALTNALQTSLELADILSTFHQEVHELLLLDGVSFRHGESGLLLQNGLPGHHSASYGLSLQGEPLGEITVSRSVPFGEEDLAQLEHMLCALLYPIRNGLRYRAALASAFVDPLTGLNNRAALDKALAREVELAHRTSLPLHMLVCDLDLFKQVNDRYGHLAGDCVLRTTANVISGMLRGSDEVFRYGGEEFVILLPGTDKDGTLLVAERIRETIAASLCECDGQQLQVTCSIGVAGLTIDDSAYGLFDRADKALYQAKGNGRNRVEMESSKAI